MSLRYSVECQVIGVCLLLLDLYEIQRTVLRLYSFIILIISISLDHFKEIWVLAFNH